MHIPHDLHATAECDNIAKSINNGSLTLPSPERSGTRWTKEDWQDAKTDSSGWADAAITAATLVEVPSDKNDDAVVLYSVPFVPLRLQNRIYM